MKLTNTQRQGNLKDEGYRRLGDRIKLITEPSALEAMIKFYTSDLKRLKGLNKPIPDVLKANLKAVKERARELGYKPKELLQRHNPALESSSNFHEMAKEVLANLEDLQKKRETLDRIFRLDVIG